MTARAEVEPFDFDSLPEPEHRYPVVIEITERHVVWIEGDSAKDAHRQLNDDGAWYEYISDKSQTLAECWHEVKPVDKWDRRLVTDGGESYRGLRCDAHVQVWKREQWRLKHEADKAACVASQHTNGDVRTFPTGSVYCKVCGYLDTVDVQLPAVAR